MLEHLLLLPNDLAVFFFGLCLVMGLMKGLPNYIKNRTFQILTFWAFFFGTASWLLLSAIGLVKYGLSGSVIGLVVSLIMGYGAYTLNKYIKTLPKK